MESFFPTWLLYCGFGYFISCLLAKANLDYIIKNHSKWFDNEMARITWIINPEFIYALMIYCPIFNTLEGLLWIWYLGVYYFFYVPQWIKVNIYLFKRKKRNR